MGGIGASTGLRRRYAEQLLGNEDDQGHQQGSGKQQSTERLSPKAKEGAKKEQDEADNERASDNSACNSRYGLVLHAVPMLGYVTGGRYPCEAGMLATALRTC